MLDFDFFLPFLFRLEDRALLLDELEDDEGLEAELEEVLEDELENEGLEDDELEDELEVVDPSSDLEEAPDSDGEGIGGVVINLLPDPPVDLVDLRRRFFGVSLPSDPPPTPSGLFAGSTLSLVSPWVEFSHEVPFPSVALNRKPCGIPSSRLKVTAVGFFTAWCLETVSTCPAMLIDAITSLKPRGFFGCFGL